MRQIRTTTSGVSVSAPIILDLYGRPNISFEVEVTGAGATWTLQQTIDNLFDTTITPLWVDFPDVNYVGQTVNRQGGYPFMPAAVRVNQTAGTGGTVLTVIQAGAGPA